MDKFLESIIQAAKDAGAKDIDIAKICLDDLTKKIVEMDKLQAVNLESRIYFENDDLVIDCIAISDKLGFAFLENTFDISEKQVKDIYKSATNEFEKCTNTLKELIENKIEEMDKGESKDVSED